MTESKSFKWGGAVFTVSPATIGSYMQTSRITAVLLDQRPDADDLARYYFSRIAAQTTVKGDVENWTPPQSSTIAASFDEWLNLPGDLAGLWVNALVEADAPTTPEELRPDADPKAKKG